VGHLSSKPSGHMSSCGMVLKRRAMDLTLCRAFSSEVVPIGHPYSEQAALILYKATISRN
jgi:hypothetical protein